MKKDPQSERVLFYSLWMLLILGIAIWRFWPTPPAYSQKVQIPVEMAPEVVPWFETGEVNLRTDTGYMLVLSLTPEYRASLESRGRWVTLGFDLLGAAPKQYRGATRAQMRPDPPRIKVLLPNPEGIVADKVRLFLRGSPRIPSQEQMR